MRSASLWCVFFAAAAAAGAGIEVNGGFEEPLLEDGTGLGWTEWRAPWSAVPFYDYSSMTDPAEGSACLYLSASSGSFGVYQEFCVEPGVPFDVSWAWRGRVSTSPGANGWWEVLLVDAPYNYDMVDAPASYMEVVVLSKWERGFGGPFPGPSEEWIEEEGGIIPTSEVVTLVLKCGSADGGSVEAWFDSVTVMHASDILDLFAIEPSRGPAAGGNTVAVTGENLPADAVVSLGGAALEDQVRRNTCRITGVAPGGAPGAADVVLTSSRGTITLPGAYQYIPAPVLQSIAPSNGPPEGGTLVTIKGDHFISEVPGDVTVTLGGLALVDVVVADAQTITGITPPGAEGPASLAVNTPYGGAVLADAFTYVLGGPQFVRGDCNGDGGINIADAVSLLSHLFAGAAEPSCVEACNANDDEGLNIADAIAILSHLFGGAGPLPAPHPECGVDPTPSLSCEVPHERC